MTMLLFVSFTTKESIKANKTRNEEEESNFQQMCVCVAALNVSIRNYFRIYALGREREKKIDFAIIVD